MLAASASPLLLAVSTARAIESPELALEASAPATPAALSGVPDSGAAGPIPPHAQSLKIEPTLSGEDRERAALLTLHTSELVRRESIPLWLSIGFVGVEAAGTAALMATWRDEPRWLLPVTFGWGLTTVASATSLFGSEDSRRRTLASVGFLPAASLALGAALAVPDERLPRLSSGAYAAGALATSVLASVNALLEHGVPIETLRSNLQALSDPSQRARLTAAELARYERDFWSRQRAIPLGITFAPMAIGGLVALYPAFDTDRTPRARWLAVAFGSAGLLSGLAGLLSEHPVAAYRSDLRRLRLTPVFIGNGVALFGTF